MEILKLIGVLVVIVGLALKLDTLATVVVAGIITGFVAGMSPLDILTVLGNAFISQRISTLFVLALPAIGICERYGLKDKAVDLIKKIANATTGRILSLYLAIRVFAAATSLRIGGHIQFIRPLIFPMAEAAAKSHKHNDLTEKETEDLKSLSAAIENYGNFFAQNIFVGASGLLLIQGTLQENGYNVSLKDLSLFSIPMGIVAIIFTMIQAFIYDKKIMSNKGGNK